MSGKRLLDFVALAKAGRNVATKVSAVHKERFNDFSKTSSLAHLIRNPTNRTSNGSGDEVVFDRHAPNASGSMENTAGVSQEGISIPSQTQKEWPSAVDSNKHALGQDHFYRKSEANSVDDPPPHETIDITQEKAASDPLPDGTIPTHPTISQSGISPSSKPSSQAARELQRKSEDQIPSKAAEPPPGVIHTNENNEIDGLFVDQEQDVFFTPPKRSGPVLSALPRVKIPKQMGTAQQSDSHLSSKHLNADVFHIASSLGEERSSRQPHSESPYEELPDDVASGLFRSPKVASQLRDALRPQISRSETSHQHSANSRRSQSDKDEAASEPTAPIISSLSKDETSKDDIRTLASDLAQETEGFNEGRDKQDWQPPDHTNSPSTTGARYEMKESRVPSSRFGRLWQYGGLATSMTFGALGEGFKRATGSQTAEGSLMLSATNMERLVAKLSRMRGAALKLGQMMSFQDSKMLPAPIHEVLRRVQDSADFMPVSQRNRVLADNLGSEWRDLFASFDDKPIAAASIGQVHRASLRESGKDVAVKVQYPGVASSINSDLSNLSILLTASRLLPKGLYLDKTIANARTELAWECDYVREATMGERFRNLVQDEQATFFVPAVIKDASGPQVLTAEFCSGIGVTKLQNFTQEQRDWIGTNILRLCLRELTEFKFMQTDPNWTNFLFNAQTKKLELLDFGAAREYPDKFIIPYIKTLIAASRSDRNIIRDLSIQLGYLTGHESQAMLNAHVDSVLTLAEPFMETAPDVYDFRGQTITDRVRSFIPVMLRERLSPPPEETYSLHRKLSGAFLLCAKLGSRVPCRELFVNAVAKVQL